MKGLGVKETPTEAVSWLQKAAEHGHAVAQFNLGLCYEDGYGVGFYPENDEVCVELGSKMINASCLKERCKYDMLLDEEIEKHRIKDFDSLIKYLSSFGEPPEDFYGLIKVDIID